jgi:hypothetical protein
MATGPRVMLQPIPLNVTPHGAQWLGAGTPGYDLGSPSAITAWGTALGVMIPNPTGNVILAYACGATPAGTWQVLVGDLVGATGQVLPATTETGSIGATTSGWLGPWSVSTYNQQAPTLVTYAGAINTTALVQAAQGCIVVDFTTTTTLAVRAYSLNPVP